MSAARRALARAARRRSTPSPPPTHQFASVPEVTHGPYDFSALDPYDFSAIEEIDERSGSRE